MSKGYTVGVIAPYLDGYYFGNLLHGIHLEARERNVRVIAIQATPDLPQRPEYQHLLAQDVDGWILIMDAVKPAFFDILNADCKPVVCIGRSHDTPGATFISPDGAKGAAQVTEHLLVKHGCKRIAFVGNPEQFDIRQRYEGYASAIRQFGPPGAEPHRINILNNLQEGGRQAARLMIDMNMPFDAVVAGTDLNAIGLIEVLEEAGYRVPEDIAVCGYDDINIAVTTKPPLTTVRQDIEQIGSTGLQVLWEKLQGTFGEMEHVKVDAAAVIRESCGCEFHGEDAGTEEHDQDHRRFIQKVSGNLYEMGIKVRQSLVSITTIREESLSWLQLTHYHSGCIAVWNAAAPDFEELIVKEVYGSRLPASLVGQTVPVKQFPQESIVRHISPDSDVMTVHLLQTSSRQIGVLVLIGPVEDHRITFGYDYIRTCFSLLAAKLERKLLSAELERSEEKYRNYFNHTPVMILVTNPQSVILDANPFFLEQTGYTLEQVAGKSFLSLLSEDSQQYYENHMLNGQQAEYYVDNMELQLVQADGAVMEGLVNSRWIDGHDQEHSHLYVTVRNITQRKKYEEQIKSYAFTDSLTGLANRLRMDTFLQEAIAHANEQQTKIAVLFIDLDKFKQVNDTFGHEAGDVLLKHVAKALQEQVRETDLAARLGGDEFILAFPGITTSEQIRSIVDRALQALRKPVSIQGLCLCIQASIGVSVYPEDGATTDELLKKADLAMYQVKLENRRSGE